MASPIRICLEHFIGSFFVFSIMGWLNFKYNLTTFGINAFIFSVSGLMIFTLIKLAFTDDVFKVRQLQ